jgi:iron uptake system component EfeO
VPLSGERARNILFLIAGVAIVGACQGSSASPVASGNSLKISVSPQGCSPSALTAAAGRIAFEVTNTGSDAAEFEVLKDDRLLDEVENIFPGVVAKTAVTLDGGTYQLACGTLQAPRGTLTVTGGPAPSATVNAIVDPALLATAQSGYQTYVRAQVADLVTRVAAFTAAIDAGDLATAKTLYATARIPYEAIEPVAELFADLDPKIDARQDDFPGGPTDPDFTGFHRLEHMLFSLNTTTGAKPFTTGLTADIASLKTEIDALTIQPRVMARGAGELIEEVAQSKLTGEEDRYSGTDLWSIQANLDGSRQIVDLLRPALTAVNATYLKQVDSAAAAAAAVLDKQKVGDGFRLFKDIPAADLTDLKARMADLAQVLADLPGTLGLGV